MIVGQFLLWARQAPPGHRAEAVGALARAYLYSGLSPQDRWEAESAMTAILDDPSALVRRALAENLASSPEAPRHLIVALASDASDIACLVLGRSPLLADCDLVDCAALGDTRVQTAIAERATVSASVSAALAEIGSVSALTALAANRGASIADFSLARIVERHGRDPWLRETLLARPDLPVEISQAIAATLGDVLGNFVVACGWLTGERSQRVVREACERTTVSLSHAAPEDDVARLVAHLRRSSQLTPGLILRAILSGGIGFAEAAFADLSGLPVRRVGAILREARGGPFRALYAKARLPASLEPAFEASLMAQRDSDDARPAAGARLCRQTVERALLACADLPYEEAGRLLALLRRFESEAARDDAREAASGIADRAALALVLEHAPQELDSGHSASLAA